MLNYAERSLVLNTSNIEKKLLVAVQKGVASAHAMYLTIIIMQSMTG